MCSTLQCYKVKDQLTVADDAQLLFRLRSKRALIVLMINRFLFQGINIFRVHVRLFFFAVYCIIQMFLDKICNNLQKQWLVVFDIQCHRDFGNGKEVPPVIVGVE